MRRHSLWWHLQTAIGEWLADYWEWKQWTRAHQGGMS